MNAAARQDAQETRIAALESRLAGVVDAVEGELCDFDARLRLVELRAGRPTGMGADIRAETKPSQGSAHAVRFGLRVPSMRPSDRSFGDVLGGRVLAWLGGIATLLGIVLFLALAISRGWIGQEARVLLAAAASVSLMTAGIWLHDHRGRTEAAVAMVGTATAGLFASLSVASGIYQLLPTLLAVVGSIAVGALATVLAVRWAGRAIGGLGLLGALMSGVLVGAPLDTATIAILAVTAACAMWVVVKQGWGWLALGTVIVSAPQWATWMLNGHTASLDLVVLTAYAALGLLGAMGAELGTTEDRRVRAAAATAALSACVLAVVGCVALTNAAGIAAGELWLAALACAHLTGGLFVLRRTSVSSTLRQLLTAIGVVLADVAFGLSVHGVALSIGWSASAAAFAWLARRAVHERSQASLYRLGAGSQIALALIRVLLDAPPSGLLAGHAQLLPLLSVAALAASCIACGHLTGAERPTWRIALDTAGLTAVAYLTASALDGAALTAALAFEALALTQLNSRTRDVVLRFGALAFASASAVHALAVDAPPIALVTGGAHLGDATVALAALAIVGLRAGGMGGPGSRRRPWPLVGAAASLLYLASLALVSAFEPASTLLSNAVLDLSVRQQSQVALSALWSLAGVTALVVGLRLSNGPARAAGLTLLLATVGKVFLYDLSTLTSVYRVMSFIVLGLLLLFGAFAYQRLRPPPLPDMRTLHPSQR